MRRVMQEKMMYPMRKLGSVRTLKQRTPKLLLPQNLTFQQVPHPHQEYTYINPAMFALILAAAYFVSKKIKEHHGFVPPSACYEAWQGTHYRFDDFKSWEDLANNFLKNYLACFPDATKEDSEFVREAILSLKTKDHEVFLNLVYWLQKNHVFNAYPHLFNQLNDICLRLAKVNVLKAMEAVYPLLAGFNYAAQRLIKHPYATQIQSATEELLCGPGSMRYVGARAFVDKLYIEALNKAYDDYIEEQLKQISPDDYTSLENIRHYYAEKLNSLSDLYENGRVVVLNQFSFEDDSTKQLKESILSRMACLENKTRGASEDLTFISAGAHFACGQIRLTKSIKNGRIHAEILIVDSKGADWGIECWTDYYRVIADIFHNDATYYVSEELNQKKGVGCSFFSALGFECLLHQDVFAFLSQPKNVTGHYPSVISTKDGVSVHSVIQFHTVRLPTDFNAMKQVITGEHTTIDSGCELCHFPLPLPKPGDPYSMDGAKKVTVAMKGRGCLRQDMVERKYSRKLEDKIIGEYLGTQLNNGKPANNGTNHYSFVQGFGVANALINNSTITRALFEDPIVRNL